MSESEVVVRDKEAGIEITKSDLAIEGAAPSVTEGLVLPDDDRGVKTIDAAGVHLSDIADDDPDTKRAAKINKAAGTVGLFKREWQQEDPLNDTEQKRLRKEADNAHVQLVDAAKARYRMKDFKQGDQLGAVAKALGPRVSGMGRLRVGSRMKGLKGAREAAIKRK